MNNPAWQLFFPDVYPDDGEGGRGWSRGKYWVWDLTQHSRVKDPNLGCFPYTSKSIIRFRVTGLLLVDDIHDTGNTESEAALIEVKRR